MMNIQTLMDSMSAVTRRTRSKYHLTLGDLVEFLESSNPDWEFKLTMHEKDAHLVAPHSYRGYYSDLAFEFESGASTVGETLALVKPCLDQVFAGYKGGDYTMDADTPLWLASYGSAGGLAIISLDVKPGSVTLVAKEVEE